MQLENRVAIVTGGGHGIGRAYCRGLAKEGAKIVVAEIDLPAATETKELVEEAGGIAIALRVDVTDEQSTLAMAEATMKTYGKIDILINNAAVFTTVPMSRVSFDKIPVDEWDKLMLVNLKGMWLCCRAVAPSMKERKSGKIINISSGTVFRGGNGKNIHYVTSKAAVLGFTRTLARELGGYGISVNTLAPGGTRTEGKDREQAMGLLAGDPALATRCFKRTEIPEDLIGPMVFLCSSASDFMTGQTMIVDGGNMMI